MAHRPERVLVIVAHPDDAEAAAGGTVAKFVHEGARSAELCQEAEVVPIVEPEVLMDGNHSLGRCAEVTQATLHAVFHALWEHGVRIEGMLLKASMVLAGAACPRQSSVTEVAAATGRCLWHTVPAVVPGIAFLSSGQPDELATAHLDAMNRLPGPQPWPLTFSFARALQGPALRTWGCDPGRVADAQRLVHHRARCASAARAGAHTAELQRSAA